MRHRRATGQALVEFVLVVPIFLTLLLGIVDFGRVVWAGNSLAAAAREAARFAIVHGGSASTLCPVGPAGPDAIIPLADANCPYPSPSKDAIRDVARAAALAGGSDLIVTVCYGVGCVADEDIPGATNVRGTPVSVAVHSNLSLVVPSLMGNSAFAVRGFATMVVSH
jgi:hypothetical protein